MYGAILGDIISLRHKRDKNGICYLVEPKVKFTDYTVTMIALADALTSADSDDINLLEEKIRQSLIRWGKEYFNANYSEHFKKWLSNLVPIDDYDDGATTRAVIIPYIYNDRDRIEKVAELSVAITHDDFESFVNSQCATFAVYYGMRSSSKNGTRNNFEHEIGFEMSEAISHGNIVVEAINGNVSEFYRCLECD